MAMKFFGNSKILPFHGIKSEFNHWLTTKQADSRNIKFLSQFPRQFWSMEILVQGSFGPGKLWSNSQGNFGSQFWSNFKNYSGNYSLKIRFLNFLQIFEVAWVFHFKNHSICWSCHAGHFYMKNSTLNLILPEPRQFYSRNFRFFVGFSLKMICGLLLWIV